MHKEREHERDCMNPRDKGTKGEKRQGGKKRPRQKRRDEKIERLGEREKRNQLANNECIESERKTGSRNRENTIYTQHLL